MKHFLLSVLLFPCFVYANEVQLGCDLEQSKANVQASLLSTPNAFGQIERETNGEKSVTVGISYSMVGATRADLVRKVAEARCDVIRAVSAIESYGRSATVTVQKSGAQHELQALERAIDLAKMHVIQLDAQLEAQVITMNQRLAALQVLVDLESQFAARLRILSRVTEKVNPIAHLLEQARQAEGRAARLSAFVVAESGWDVKLVGGAQQSIGRSSSSATPFATIAITYSFGYNAAKSAAQRVGQQTEYYLASQSGGYTQQVVRLQQELQALYDAETLTHATLVRHHTHVLQARASIIGVETVLAFNTLRELNIQLLVLEGQAAGAEARAKGYLQLLKDLK